MLRRLSHLFAASEGAVRKLLIVSMALGFVSLIAAGVGAVVLTARTADHARWVDHTYRVELAVARARIAVEQSETTRRGYLLGQQQVYLNAYRRVAATIPEHIAEFERLTLDNPGQQARGQELRRYVADLVRQRELTIRLAQRGQLAAATASFATERSVRRLAVIRDTFDAMTAEEQRLLNIRDGELRGTSNAFYWVLALAGLLLALVVAASVFTVLRYVRDLDHTSRRLAELNEGLEDEVQVRTADLTRANEEIQRFAYIVSHDLRSPLVNVMGFTAELDTATQAITELIDRVQERVPEAVTKDAERAAREDLPEAINFIRASTAKMDRLINAILKLSREGRRVLSPEPIDMTALVAGIRDTLAHAADQKGLEIVVEPLPPLTGDRVAVEQIFSNLVENATKYLEPGRSGRVAVSGRRDGARAVYTVADNGRGIDPKDHARIFDLFRRSGRQDQPGEGIGLAHARALAIRLGGMIDVQSTLGEGAAFHVSLPVQFTQAEERSA